METSQVVAIKKIPGNGIVRFNKNERRHLHLHTMKKIAMSDSGEMLLSPSGDMNPDASRIELSGNAMQFPPDVRTRLNLGKTDRVAFISHAQGIALKKVRVELADHEEAFASLVDLETSDTLVRRVTPQMEPAEAVESLRSGHKGINLVAKLHDALEDEPSFLGWVVRDLVSATKPGDDALRTSLIEDRYNAQEPDGSFGSLMNTTRKLRELSDLHADPRSPAVEEALEWLVGRLGSPYNPGLFFINEEEAALHPEIVDPHPGIAPPRKYFRKRQRKHEEQITEADGITYQACGPQMLWPTSYALEVLLRFGMEDHERVQQIYRTYGHYGTFCECGCQGGPGDFQPRPEEFFRSMIDSARARYTYGGISNADRLLHWATANGTFGSYSRTPDGSEGVYKRYALKPTLEGAGCSANVVRGLSLTTSPLMKLVAENILYQVALCQKPEGDFHGLGKENFGSFHFISVFAEWEHPVAHTVILRAIPWLQRSQNPDGTWGKDDKIEQTTIMVVKALRNVGKVD